MIQSAHESVSREEVSPVIKHLVNIELTPKQGNLDVNSCPENSSNLPVLYQSNPPATVEYFQQILKIEKEDLVAYQSIIGTLQDIDAVRKAKEMALRYAQNNTETMLLAEAKLGELLMNSEPQDVPLTADSPKGDNGKVEKQRKNLPSGITKRESSQACQIAQNWDIAAQVIETAKKKGDIPTLQKVLQEIRKKTIVERHQGLRTQDFPPGKYGIILADPAWEYKNSGFRSSANSHYPTMATEQICKLEVPSLCTDSSILFLWATNPLLPEAFEVMNSWGFTYKTNMPWVKKGGQGIGWYSKSSHELLLIGVKPKTPHPRERFDSFFETQRLAHSKKPDLAYEIIESMYPDYKKLELFARNKREGWDSWGNEC